MANRVRIATFSVDGFDVDAKASLAAAAGAGERYWSEKLAEVLPDRPDLVVLPECASRPISYQGPENAAKLSDYYAEHGERLVELCRRIAAENGTTIVCSCSRVRAGGRRYNCSTVIGPDGETLGVYAKNHLTINESEGGNTYGARAEVIATPWGRIACAICFDLNFDELRAQYRAARPDLIVFSSMYHGGGQQIIWPYLCRAHFVGAMGGRTLPAEIRNPFGAVLYATTNYCDHVVGAVNLDCVMAHLDYNYDKLAALKKRYGPEVTIHDPGLYGAVLITSESALVTAAEMARQFNIELLDDYMERAREHRRIHGGQGG